jgi:hypothetical protein
MRRLVQVVLLSLIVATVAGVLPAQQPRKKKKLLAIGAVQGFQHDSVSNGLATMWKLGQESGLWDTYSTTSTRCSSTPPANLP